MTSCRFKCSERYKFTSGEASERRVSRKLDVSEADRFRSGPISKIIRGSCQSAFLNTPIIPNNRFPLTILSNISHKQSLTLLPRIAQIKRPQTSSNFIKQTSTIQSTRNQLQTIHVLSLSSTDPLPAPFPVPRDSVPPTPRRSQETTLHHSQNKETRSLARVNTGRASELLRSTPRREDTVNVTRNRFDNSRSTSTLDDTATGGERRERGGAAAGRENESDERAERDRKGVGPGLFRC